MTEVRTLDAVIDEAVFAQPRFSLLLLGVFAGVGLLLAVVGVYGIVAYSVAQQRAEFGVRLALGATRGDVLRLVLRRGIRLMAAGTAGRAGAGVVGDARPERAGLGCLDPRSAGLRGGGGRAGGSWHPRQSAARAAGGAIEPARGAAG